MRELTLEELELVAGGNDSDIVVTGNPGDSGDWGDFGDSGGSDGGSGPADPPPPPPCQSGNGTSPSVNHDFISHNEGGVRDNGYVPNAGHSGVTVGAGVDLGQQSVSGLQSMGVSQSIIDQVSPYLGLQQGTASTYLADHPLTLSTADATSLTDMVQDAAITHIATAYDSASAGAGSNIHFDDLPQGTQTAIADLAYQYTDPTNPHLDSATPHFWNDVITGQWNAAVNELNNFGDAYATRRGAEANLLQGDVNGGLMNGSSSIC